MDNKLNLYGLAIECPFRDECPDCPIKKIRKINDFEKQIEFIDNLTLDEINELIHRHNKNRLERENQIRNNNKNTDEMKKNA